MAYTNEVIEMAKKLVATENELESATVAADTMKTYIAALIKENTLLRRKLDKIRFILGDSDDVL